MIAALVLAVALMLVGQPLRGFFMQTESGTNEAAQATTTTDVAPGPGIPRALAEDRARRIADLRYELELSIPAAQTERLTGRITIRFTLKDAARALALDFAPADSVRRATIAGTFVSLTRIPDHLIVPPEHLREGANEISIEFAAGDAPLNRNPEFLYSLFVPARAHLAFPCFDQPDLKARWTLSLEMPADWEAVANAAEMERSAAGGRRRLRFAETGPLPTYLFAFGAGRFSVETAERSGRTFRMLHRETDAAKVARNRDLIFDLHASALAWLERYTAIPYPWGKFDFLLVPSFQFGGMEHAGAIFYNASALLLDPSATQNQELGRASLIAHETAHMWFGDLVTMRWFDDVWMKEVFANFMAAKIVNPSFPAINHDLRFLYAHYPAAYDVDRTPGTNAIRQQLDNLNEAGTLYGPIIYQKAPIVMRQLELILGEGPFRKGLRTYLKDHSFGNASWPDLIDLLDRLVPEDLAAWSRAWVEEPGRPIIATDLQLRDGQIVDLSFVQRDPAASRGLMWNQRLLVTMGLPDGTRTFDVAMAGARVEVPAARGLAAPSFVLPSGGGRGYGGFELDPRSIDYLLERLPDIEDPLTRGAAWVTLWDQMLDGRAPASRLVDLAVRALPRETDEQNVQRMLSYARQAYWRFLSPSARDTATPALERVLREGIDRASSSSLKSAWFSALRDMARSDSVLGWLERVWRRSEEVPGLTLAEPDYITLAMELAVRGVPAWKEILDEQVDRIENPDRKARFLFVRPALSPDVAVRDAFFESLKVADNRRREPWVLEGLAYLHHPLRAAAAERHIPAALEMLREIQRTGDIFFPRRWTDATLSGHSSASAARMVKQFLDGLPAGYPDRLRRVVLASSDDLFRATRLREGFGGVR
ncbi:MAG TPA: M1 family aminopeptidase [Vicinamibacterales bacterium]|nr:M1 family aminopeptidase [Vicinamibacterales bacterium]